MEIEAFSKVKITVDGQEYEGQYLPSEDDTLIVLKLDSGYNAGYLKENVTDIKVLSAPEKKETSKQDVKQDDSLPKVMVVHTGGTIASRVDYSTGGVVGQFSPEELIGLFPELKDVAYIESEFLGNMSSEDFRFVNFNKAATAIFEAAKKGVTRFIVTSGTDFLHYMSAALSFILKDVPVGVVVVGSQRSSDRGSSDSAINLLCATQFLAKTNFRGVVVCMHEGTSDNRCTIIPGTNARKMHSSVRGAFKPINAAPLAHVHYPNLDLDLKEMMSLCEGDLPKELPLLSEDLKIGLVYSHPNFFADELNAYDNFDGLVLAGSGLGHMPVTETIKEHAAIYQKLTSLAKKMPVVMSVQTIYGRTNMNVYSPGRKLQEIAVLGQQSSMITETAFIKLAWLLSNHKDQVAELFMKDLVGELPKITIDTFFGDRLES